MSIKVIKVLESVFFKENKKLHFESDWIFLLLSY